MTLVGIFIVISAIIAAVTAFSDWAKTVDPAYAWALGGVLLVLWLWWSISMARRQARELRELRELEDRQD